MTGKLSLWDSLHTTHLPSSFSDFLISHVAAKVAQRTELLFGQVQLLQADSLMVLTTLLAADANLPTANEVAGTTVTASNVIAQLGSIVDAIPSTLYGSEDLNIYVSQNIARAYVRALGGFAVAATSNAGTNARGLNGMVVEHYLLMV
jgi:hypothetical protein